ncbi:5-deoxy-glucuronate isomerase [Erysipelothrix sp. HDW6C]|uniref:5-deoxy-glucuronate isomerase n=1 Tax=Erysipelothrix sp. HDW6C TaxID=2714930 RepID=UPI00140A58A7|nr:5-deoxy-glucuronate isomerase [Erysipelothrix sp. HDW6C]QIK69276.1 5-deoxy-glucuronate isomerase [Erysipelothrix sp. HDW6C]
MRKIVNQPLGSTTMEYTGLEVFELEPEDVLEMTAPKGVEYCVVLLYGYGHSTINETNENQIGNRMSVFSDTVAYALYICELDSFRFVATTEAQIAVCSGKSNGTHPSRMIPPNINGIEQRGYGNIKRTAKNILPESDPADSLLIVEVITEGGNWSSFPSHRHDENDLPHQSMLEEIYFHKVNPSEKGFALQRVYNDDTSIDEAYVLKDNTVVNVPQGYHPVSVPPGCTLYYLNVMAGPTRTWVFHNDPTFEHLIK